MISSVFRRGRLRFLAGAALVVVVSGKCAARHEVGTSKVEASHAYRQRIALAAPQILYTAHNRGQIQLALANNGTFGTFGDIIPDPFTGELIPSCTYPRNSELTYLWVGAFWIGAVIGRDTVVSVGSEDFYETSEFWPEEPNLGGRFKYNSIDINSKFYNPQSSMTAYSEQDIYCEYYDTLTDVGLTGQDPVDLRLHKPLGIKVSQLSMAWSYDYADDFILFDYQIENIGTERLRKVYMGIWVDGDAFHITRRSEVGWNDDVVGFLRSHPAPEGCNFIDTVNIAYHGDNDGDPIGGAWDYRSVRSVIGARVVRTPADTLEFSFNWWATDYYDQARDFGPRRRGVTGDPFRSFGSRLGTPEGDRNRYYLLSHKEFDYDLYFTAVDHSGDGWLPPPSEAADLANGYDCRYLLSFGPFDIEPGQVLPVSFAWVGGENFHASPTAFADLFNPREPQTFYNTLDFSKLALNARWASWVYDTPGLDTDGDGDRGRYRICGQDTMGVPVDSIDTTGLDLYWYEGDGVPDFSGAGPPPAPLLRVIPSVGRLTIRWNGYYSETEDDPFLGMPDFEGYRVYAGLDERDQSFTLLASYDRQNYSRYRWKDDSEGIPAWVLEETPFTLDSLQRMFGNPDFDPLHWTRANPFRFDGEVYYFEKQDFNVSDLGLPNGIRKAYPEIVSPPPSDPRLWSENEVTREHGVPLPSYYEYEYVYDRLLATIPYYIAVTAFDFGSPAVGLPALETDPVNNHVVEFAQSPADTVEAHRLDVYIYPNPYRLDEGYRSRGFEGRRTTMRDRPDDRVRRIHFANLPYRCRISIYSLDGDLVREWEHQFEKGAPGAMHDSWDLITRNTQLVVSGLYYWVVESENRHQIGKLVIIH
ncbi:MAG TPA: hypothetical protein VMY05_09760 [Acidobacteriota bacterium]|nr:hypothetical protein [Acidobacteriota bacterium]